MNLQEKRIVVTRAPHQAEKFADMLRERGAEPVLFPCIDIVPPEDTSELDDALDNVARFDWIVLTSANTVVALEKRLSALNMRVDALSHLKVASVGRKTAKFAQKRLNLTVDVMPEKQVAEELAAAMPDVRGKRVFLPQSEIAREVLAELLTQAGANVIYVSAYRTVTGSGGASPQQVRESDALTFTSPSTVTGFVERCGGVVDLPAVCIGSITGDAARKAGFVQVLEPENDYSLGGMLDVLEVVFGEKIHDDTGR